MTSDKLYKAIKLTMKASIAKINAKNRAANPLCPLLSQMPMRGGSKAMTKSNQNQGKGNGKGKVKQTVLGNAATFASSSPSVPPSPNPPQAVKLTDSAIHLVWSNPEFSGEAANEYSIQARGTAKLNRAWRSVGTYSKIKTTWFNVVHLVVGVALQFRVRAHNHGGWGDWSGCSDFYKPYTNPIMPIKENMQVAIAIGAREVLRR